MTHQQLADVLTAAAGDTFHVEGIDILIAAGAPTNDDGTINLLHLTAWLAGRVS